MPVIVNSLVRFFLFLTRFAFVKVFFYFFKHLFKKTLINTNVERNLYEHLIGKY